MKFKTPQSREVEKIIESAGVLLNAERSRQMSRIRLIKLLYIANRRAIKDLGQPILCGVVCAMKHGPVHSEAYNLIKNEHPQTPRWAHFFANDQRDVKLVKPTGQLKLSRAEIEILKRVSDELAQMSDWDLVDICHGFKEWDEHYPDRSADTSVPIPFEEIVSSATGDNEFKAELILQESADRDEFDRLFAQ